MAHAESQPAVTPRADARRLWLLAVLWFGVGDVATTGIGLGLPGVVEAHPVAASLLGQSPLWTMVAVKACVFAGCYVVWRRVPSPHRVGVPLGLAVSGVLVCAWNFHVILSALGP